MNITTINLDQQTMAAILEAKQDIAPLLLEQLQKIVGYKLYSNDYKLEQTRQLQRELHIDGLKKTHGGTNTLYYKTSGEFEGSEEGYTYLKVQFTLGITLTITPDPSNNRVEATLVVHFTNN